MSLSGLGKRLPTMLPVLLAAFMVVGQFTGCSLQKQVHVPAVVAQSADIFTGQVVRVTDGDTIEVRRADQIVKIRLNGIDAPERKQTYGPEATQLTSQLVLDKSITVHVKDVDRYHRLVADIILDDGRVLNQELVKAGLAWWYEKYALNDEILMRLQREAQAMKRGLWQQEYPIPPWEFRRKQ